MSFGLVEHANLFRRPSHAAPASLYLTRRRLVSIGHKYLSVSPNQCNLKQREKVLLVRLPDSRFANRNKENTMGTRRDFLTTSGAGVVATCGMQVPSFLQNVANASQPSNGERILVVVQLSGGNDGINTIVPHRDEVYRTLRPDLRIQSADAVSITKDLGFHPRLRKFADLLDAGVLAVIQGVGYENPNHSHFESMDIWHSCQRKEERSSAGWLGRYLDSLRESKGSRALDSDAVAAIHLGDEKQPLALQASDTRVPSVRSLERFRLDVRNDRQLLQAIEQSIPSASGDTKNDLLGFVQSSASSALKASEQLARAKSKTGTNAVFPKSGLGQKLKQVAQLIQAGLKTRVYYVTLDGFDTHARQAAAHGSLLSEFSEAVYAFWKQIEAAGERNRVMLMAFSEFGRRVKENASGGTDHGTAGPMFLVGPSVRSGLLGKTPRLDDLFRGDLKFTTDFRRVYATVVRDWLHCDIKTCLGGEFEPFDALT